jgi:hypothetical protein
MKGNKEKIEFWLHANQKGALKRISEETGYTVSELMRRGVEFIIKDLLPNPNHLESPRVPYKKEVKNVQD